MNGRHGWLNVYIGYFAFVLESRIPFTYVAHRLDTLPDMRRNKNDQLPGLHRVFGVLEPSAHQGQVIQAAHSLVLLVFHLADQTGQHHGIAFAHPHGSGQFLKVDDRVLNGLR